MFSCGTRRVTVLILWQLAHTTSHFSISARMMSSGLDSLTISATSITFVVPGRWSKSSAAQWALYPQSTQPLAIFSSRTESLVFVGDRLVCPLCCSRATPHRGLPPRRYLSATGPHARHTPVPLSRSYEASTCTGGLIVVSCQLKEPPALDGLAAPGSGPVGPFTQAAPLASRLRAARWWHAPSAASSSAGSRLMHRIGSSCLLPYPRGGGFTMDLIQLFLLMLPEDGNGGRSGAEPPYPP